MPTWPEITRSLYGAWRLARFDPGGMNYFDLSIEGFWRSFGAAVIALPIYAYLVATNWIDVEFVAARHFFILGLEYVLIWIALPIVMIVLAILFDLKDRYVQFIIAANWASVLQLAVFIPLNTMFAFGNVATVGGMLLVLLTYGYVLVYSWFIARTALETSISIAAFVVAISAALSFAIGYSTQSLF